MQADLGFLPILLFWGAMILVARAQQAKKRQASRSLESMSATSTASEPRQRGLMDELTRAMEELKRAEQQQRQRTQYAAKPEGRASRRSLFQPIVNEPSPDEGSEDETDYDTQAEREIEERRKTIEEIAPRRIPIAAAASPTPITQQPAPSPLARFGHGTARDALVLNEILGRPRSERMDD